MYFFLDDRISKLTSLVRAVKPGLDKLRTEVQDALKSNPSNVDALKIQHRANLYRAYSKTSNTVKLELAKKTQSSFGMFCSLFIPWSEEYNMREQVGKNLSKAESNFSKLTKLAAKGIRR